MENISHSVSEACNIIGIGKTKFYEILKSGEIKFIKIGTRTLIPHAELSSFINQLKHT